MRGAGDGGSEDHPCGTGGVLTQRVTGRRTRAHDLRQGPHGGPGAVRRPCLRLCRGTCLRDVGHCSGRTHRIGPSRRRCTGSSPIRCTSRWRSGSPGKSTGVVDGSETAVHVPPVSTDMVAEAPVLGEVDDVAVSPVAMHWRLPDVGTDDAVLGQRRVRVLDRHERPFVVLEGDGGHHAGVDRNGGLASGTLGLRGRLVVVGDERVGHTGRGGLADRHRVVGRREGQKCAAVAARASPCRWWPAWSGGSGSRSASRCCSRLAQVVLPCASFGGVVAGR